MDFSNKNKKSDVVLKAFKAFLKNIDKVPRSILMDAGTEFVLVRKWCAENNIKTYLPYSSFHGSFIERFNQSIKNRVYRWMDSNKTENYIDSLGSILEGIIIPLTPQSVYPLIMHGVINPLIRE